MNVEYDSDGNDANAKAAIILKEVDCNNDKKVG
jgi:hypothetical protein